MIVQASRAPIPLRVLNLAAAPAGEEVRVVAALKSFGAGGADSWRRDGRGTCDLNRVHTRARTALWADFGSAVRNCGWKRIRMIVANVGDALGGFELVRRSRQIAGRDRLGEPLCFTTGTAFFDDYTYS